MQAQMVTHLKNNAKEHYKNKTVHRKFNVSIETKKRYAEFCRRLFDTLFAVFKPGEGMMGLTCHT